MRILVINPTPAVQRRLVFDAVQPNAVNRAREVELLPSGKGLNCARAAKLLGADVEVVLFAGGATGDWLCTAAESEGIHVRAVRVESATRTCTTVVESETGVVTELVENASPVTPHDGDVFVAECSAAAKDTNSVVITGTIPEGAGEDLYAHILSSPAFVDRIVIVDAQGSALIEALGAKPWLVKPNRRELAAATGIDCTLDDGVRSAISRLHELGAQRVLVTDGSHAGWLSNGTSVSRIPVLRVRVENPIGAGDSVAAGLAVMTPKMLLLEAAGLALVCGSASASGGGYGRLDLTAFFAACRRARKRGA